MIRNNIVISVAVLLVAVFILIQLFLFKDRRDHSNVNDRNEYIDEKTENTIIENDRNEEIELPEIEVDIKADEDISVNDSEDYQTGSPEDTEYENEQQPESQYDPQDIYTDEDGVIELPEVS